MFYDLVSDDAYDDFISEDTLEALGKIEGALDRIETAIKENNLLRQLAVPFIAIVIFYFFVTSAWHSKWRYVVQYQVGPKKVTIAKEPHDCDFIYAPIGAKFCEYNQTVSTVRWGRSQNGGEPIISTDEGKTWLRFTPEPGVEVPNPSTIEEVNVEWEKKDD